MEQDILGIVGITIPSSIENKLCVTLSGLGSVAPVDLRGLFLS